MDEQVGKKTRKIYRVFWTMVEAEPDPLLVVVGWLIKAQRRVGAVNWYTD